MREHTIARVTVHHTAIDASAPIADHLRDIQAFHQGERGWPDIAYHVFVAPDGTTWEGRELRYVGDSATEYDLAGHAHVALLGNFEERRSTAEQEAGAFEVIERLLSDHALTPNFLGAHRDYADTACPGGAFYPVVASWRERLASSEERASG